MIQSGIRAYELRTLNIPISQSLVVSGYKQCDANQQVTLKRSHVSRRGGLVLENLCIKNSSFACCIHFFKNSVSLNSIRSANKFMSKSMYSKSYHSSLLICLITQCQCVWRYYRLFEQFHLKKFPVRAFKPVNFALFTILSRKVFFNWNFPCANFHNLKS